MDQQVTPTAEVVVNTPMSHEQIIDLRRRVLAGEQVSNDELRRALEALALTRVTAAQGVAAKAAKATSVIVPKIDLNAAFAAFKAKSSGSASSGGQ